MVNNNVQRDGVCWVSPWSLNLGDLYNTVEILVEIYLRKQKHLRILGDTSVPPLDILGLLEANRGQNAHLCARENPVYDRYGIVMV